MIAFCLYYFSLTSFPMAFLRSFFSKCQRTLVFIMLLVIPYINVALGHLSSVCIVICFTFGIGLAAGGLYFFRQHSTSDMVFGLKCWEIQARILA